MTYLHRFTATIKNKVFDIRAGEKKIFSETEATDIFCDLEAFGLPITEWKRLPFNTPLNVSSYIEITMTDTDDFGRCEVLGVECYCDGQRILKP